MAVNAQADALRVYVVTRSREGFAQRQAGKIAAPATATPFTREPALTGEGLQ